MNRFLMSMLFLSVLISCHPQDGIKTMNFGKFTIEVPGAWKKKKLLGEDSYVGGIVMESGKMAVFDLGYYSNDLEDIDSMAHEIEWKFIDGRRAKLVTPKGLNGYTGIYIDSLWIGGYFGDDPVVVGFQMGASDLSQEEKEQLRATFITLKFRDR